MPDDDTREPKPDREPDQPDAASAGSRATPAGADDAAGPGDEEATLVTRMSGEPPPAPDLQVTTPMPGFGGGDEATRATMAQESDATQATLSAGGAPGQTVELQPGTVWGDFEIGRLLGRGGMGAVYAGRQISLDRPVAIKVLPDHLSSNEAFRKRFQLEARAVAKISSPHVVQVYGAGEHGGHSYFAMEYVEGRDLGERLKAGFRPSQEQAIDLILQAARGLAAAGEQEIVHRDIKPSNMMVTDDLQLKLMDFGLVKLTKATTALTLAGTVMGTVSYFSPEQGRGEECDQRTDIYALGIVFYELLTGVLPFTGDDATSVIYQHIHSEPRLPTEINPGIREDCQAVILKCMQKDAGNRYQQARELIADLELLQRGQAPITAFHNAEQLRTGATMTKSTAFEVERQRGGAGKLVAALVVLALLAAGGWFGLTQWQAQQGTVDVDPAGGPPTDPAAETGPAQDNDPVEPAPADPGTVADTSQVDAQWLADCRRLLDAGELTAVQEKISSLSQQEAADPRVQALIEELGHGRSATHVRLAREAIAAGQLEKAGNHIALLQASDADHPQLQELRDLVARVSEVRQRIADVGSLVHTGDIEGALTLAAELDIPAELPAEQARLAELRKRASSISQLLETARSALARDDLATARQSYLTAFDKFENVAASKGLKIVSICDQFNNALARGAFGKATEHLRELEGLGAANEVVANRRAELETLRLVAAAEAALGRHDFAAARQERDRLAAIAPGADALKSLDHRIELAELQLAFTRALDAEDLARAQAELAAIKAHDGENAAWREARERLAASQLEEQAREAAIAEQTAAVAARIAADQPDLAAAADDLQQLRQQYGDRADLAALAERLASRRRELAIVARLAELDAAVLGGDREQIAAIVDDAEHRAALVSLVGRDGLVFAHTPVAFGHDEAAVRLDVDVKTGMRAFPETTVAYRYTCVQQDGSWRITAVAQRQP